MAAYTLLRNKYKKVGWIILVPSTILGLVLAYKGFSEEWVQMTAFAFVRDGGGSFGDQTYFSFAPRTNVTNTLIGSLFIIGGLLVTFSKEKNEDEFIAELRLSSLLWAVGVSYLLLLVGFLFVYGTPFLDVMVYNMFTVLIIFIIRFNYILYKNAKAGLDEK